MKFLVGDGPAIRPLRSGASEAYSPATALACPRCGCAGARLGPCRRVPGHDGGMAWAGLGDLEVIELDGTCGAHWDLCLGVDGDTVWLFTRVIRPCANPA